MDITETINKHLQEEFKRDTYYLLTVDGGKMDERFFRYYNDIPEYILSFKLDKFKTILIEKVDKKHKRYKDAYDYFNA